jgi:hypothetical protein
MFIGAIAILRNANPADTVPVMCRGDFDGKHEVKIFFLRGWDPTAI